MLSGTLRTQLWRFGLGCLIGWLALWWAPTPPADSAAAAAVNALPLRLAAAVFDPLVAAPAELFDAQWLLPVGRNLAPATRYYLLQLHAPLDAAARAQLDKLGVELLDPIPHYAFVVRVAPGAQPRVAADPLVRWMGPLEPAFRLDPTLRETVDADPLTAEPRALIVSLFPGENPSPLLRQIAQLGGATTAVGRTDRNARLLVSLPQNHIPALAALEGVNWMEPAPNWALQNAAAAVVINAPAVWEAPTGLSLTGRGQVVAIADTGIDRGSADPALLHDDFEDGLGGSRLLAVYDRSDDGPQDANWHGTHVAGIAVGNGLRSGSQPGAGLFTGSHSGVAPEAGLLVQALARNNGALVGIPLYLDDLFEQARANSDGIPVYIHSNSWGSPGTAGLYSVYSQDVDTYMWQHPDFLIVFAAGNDARDANGDGLVDPGSVMAPGTAKNGLTVGSSENYRPELGDLRADNPDQLAPRSGRGPTRDGRYKPDLVAPGTSIYSTATSLVYSGSYVIASGTSMATPRVAGAAALAREYVARQNHHAGAALIKALLVNGAYDLYDAPINDVTTPRPSTQAGWGRLDLAQSFAPDGSAQVSWWETTAVAPERAAPALSVGETAVFTMTVGNPERPLRVTLAWTDYPGSALAGGGLVNDLDLHLVAPDGTLLYPNQANSGGLPDAYDHVNNIEGVDVDAPQPGDYQVVVYARHVPHGPQPFALVATADSIVPETPEDPEDPGEPDDPNIRSHEIQGAGVYQFGDTGLTLDVLSGSGSVTVSVVHNAPEQSHFPTVMARRHYHVQATGTAIIANATFAYDDADLPEELAPFEADLRLFRWDGAYWLRLEPHARDTEANLIGIDALVLTGEQDWAFGWETPTAVAYVASAAQTAVSPAAALTALAGLATATAWLGAAPRRGRSAQL